VTRCSDVVRYQRSAMPPSSSGCSDDGGSKVLRNIGILLTPSLNGVTNQKTRTGLGGLSYPSRAEALVM
jgi:hypothetical protein